MAKKQAEYANCPVCKTRFRVKRSWAKYCSPKCSQKALRSRRVGHSGGVVAATAKTPPEMASDDLRLPCQQAFSEYHLAVRRLEPERMGHGKWEYKYEVRLGDELVVIDRDPECSACRALLAKGITGTARFMYGGAPYMTMNIERAAQYRVRETERHGPRFVKYQPFPSEIVRTLQEAC
jgi:hypothetical protein